MFIDWNKGVIKACGAGHPGPFLLPVSGDDPRLGKKKSKDGSIPPISMQLKGPPLGESSQPVFETSEMPLRAGDRVVLYSDGLIECENIHGKQWGKKNLTRAISGMASQDPGQWKMKIIDEAFQFFDRVPIKDDVTIVVVECDRAWVPAPAETPIPPPAVQAVEPPSESLFSMNLGGDGSESASS
jgi:serine phosphatase RsbU (regulator of sigma subunit)